MTSSLEPYEEKLLSGWEEVSKKGQLTFWILLAIKQRPMTMSEVKEFIDIHTKKTITADDKSMYRALRRYVDIDLLITTSEYNPTGPDKKLYTLTVSGKKIIAAYIERNVSTIYMSAHFKDLIR